MKARKSGKLAFCGVLTALALVLLLFTASPVATVALAAVAAVCGVPVVVEAGRRAALLHVLAVAVLALLLVPAVEGKVLYVAFFGWYTVFKAWLEGKSLPRLGEWGVKLGTFVLAMAGGALVLWLVLKPTIPYHPALLAGAAVGLCGVFFLYDWGLTGLVGLYVARVHPVFSRIFRF